jgi:hypothetical protein
MSSLRIVSTSWSISARRLYTLCRISFTATTTSRLKMSNSGTGAGLLWPRSSRLIHEQRPHWRPLPPSKKMDEPPASPTLRENIYTIPNFLTVSRILACPVLGWAILEGDYILATSLLTYAGLTDYVSLILVWIRSHECC